MIYYKKKSIIKKVAKYFTRKTQDDKSRVFLFFKRFFASFIVLFLMFYFSCLFLAPRFIDEDDVKNVFNNYLLKNDWKTVVKCG